jgi:pyruvate formate lyase activating enzyme
LAAFFQRIKGLGFATKLDTNGTNPQALEELYQCKLLDYVAMDIKHHFGAYQEIVGVSVDMAKIKQSIALIKSSGVDYEFRTTVVPYFHTVDAIKAIAMQLSGAKKFALQEFLPDHAINGNLTNDGSIFAPKNEKILEDVVNFYKLHFGEVIIRRAN